MSENIRVRSILGRFLEHSRIFYFENSAGTEPHLLAGSADWMPRNFFRRIECVFPVEDVDIRERLIGILETYLTDTKHARFLRSTGAYYKSNRNRKGTEAISAQLEFMLHAAKRRALMEKPVATEKRHPVPHTPIVREEPPE